MGLFASLGISIPILLVLDEAEPVKLARGKKKKKKSTSFRDSITQIHIVGFVAFFSLSLESFED